MNSNQFVGNLTKDVELKTIKKDGEELYVAEVTVAINGYRELDAPVVIIFTAWRNTAEICSRFGKKGKLVAIESHVTNHTYLVNDKTVFSYNFIVDRIRFLSGDRQKDKQESMDEKFANQAQSKDKNLPF